MRLPPPLIAAAGSLAVALGLAAIPLIVASPTTAQAQDTPTQSVTLDEWSINPRHIVVKANQPVRFTITNAGVTNTHDLNIAGLGEEFHSEATAPGQTITWDVTFSKPGTYLTWCSRGSGSHKDRGIVGTLTVVPADQDAVLNVPVQLGDFYFNPMAATAVAGQTTRFQLEDVGAISHVLVIEGHGIEMRSPTVRPGEPVTWDVTFDEPGTYEIYCNFNVQGVLHRDMGMLGTLEVLRGGGGM